MFAGALALLLSVFPGSTVFAVTAVTGVSATTNIQVKVGGDDREDVRVNATEKTEVKESSDRSSTTTNKDGWTYKTEQKENDDGDRIEIDHDGALNATTTVKNPGDVYNRGQLRSFLNHLVKDDGRVASIQVSSTTIQTEYALPARFLGAIPMNLSTHISVGADGSVTVTYPWYAFLFGNRDEKLKDQIAKAASSTPEVGTSVTLSASVQAHLLNLLMSVLKGE